MTIRVTVFLEAYEARRKPHVARLGIELRDASGRAVATHALQRQSAAAPTAASVHAFAPSLTLEDVRPGRYTLRVEASSSLDSRRSLARESQSPFAEGTRLSSLVSGCRRHPNGKSLVR